jgi:hypothetical protein
MTTMTTTLIDDVGMLREINASSRVKRLVVYSPEPR